ncbi:MAG: DUF928 domain-containing protein [Stenomitos frigidus ULC029]
MRLAQGIKAVSLAFLFSAIVTVDLIETAIAQPTQETRIARSSRRRLNFRVGVRPSRVRIGGFSRGSCGNQPQLVALVPPPQTQERLAGDKTTVDKTTSGHPTFFVHLPALPGSTGQFILKDEANTKELYSVDFDLTGQSGIVGIALPDSTPTLQIGQKYRWQVAVNCDPNQPSRLVIISSWIERVKPPATQGKDKLAVLAQQGIWQDTVTLLALQRYQRPNDRTVAEDWAALMDDAGLPQFKQSAVVQIVKN